MEEYKVPRKPSEAESMQPKVRKDGKESAREPCMQSPLKREFAAQQHEDDILFRLPQLPEQADTVLG